MDNLPVYMGNNFKCPHCQVLSEQTWFNKSIATPSIIDAIKHLYFDHRMNISDYQQEAILKFLRTIESSLAIGVNGFFPSIFSVSTCSACQNISLWIEKDKVYPISTNISKPNEDMENDIKQIYLEAASIYEHSPKGSTALLRLALQKLLKQIGKSGKDINSDIKELVAEGLSLKIQQALDLLRVIGNNAVHPGQIDLNDNSEVALKLFTILNFIADEMITKPKELENLYNDMIPKTTKEHIRQRDGK